MTNDRFQASSESEPRLQAALEELRGIIGRHVPTATFTVTRGEDPTGIYLTPVVDVEDWDEVTDVFLDRLIELQVEEGLPVYVIPDQPPERALARLCKQAARQAEALLPAP